MKSEPVLLINSFEIPVGEDRAFMRGWERARDFLRTQPGYVSATLHRSITPDADFRFVNVALWESAEDFRAATSRPEFRNAAFPYRFHAALYQVVTTDESTNGAPPVRAGTGSHG